MTKTKIIDLNIIRKMIGEIQPTGKVGIDDNRFENLKAMTEMVGDLIHNIGFIATSKDKEGYSIKRAGKYADKFLKRICEINGMDETNDKVSTSKEASTDKKVGTQKKLSKYYSVAPAVLMCPLCNKTIVIYHFSWGAITCSNCKEMVEKEEWYIVEDESKAERKKNKEEKRALYNEMVEMTKRPRLFESSKQFKMPNQQNQQNQSDQSRQSKSFSSYEKIVQSAVAYTHHIVRIKLDSNIANLKSILKDIPDRAILDEVYDEENYCELVFKEKA